MELVICSEDGCKAYRLRSSVKQTGPCVRCEERLSGANHYQKILEKAAKETINVDETLELAYIRAEDHSF